VTGLVRGRARGQQICRERHVDVGEVSVDVGCGGLSVKHPAYGISEKAATTIPWSQTINKAL
jgi:hypothetical protein